MLPAWAQQYETAAPASGTSLSDFSSDLTEGAQLHYGLSLIGQYTDNYYNQKDVTLGAWGASLLPSASYSYALPRFRFGIGGQADVGYFSIENDAGTDNDSENYVDTGVTLGAAWQSALRHQFVFGADLQFDHDPYGSARTEGTPGVNSDLDEWRREVVDVKYTYGLPTSPLNVELRAGTIDKTYTTNQTLTYYLSYQAAVASATAYYHLTAKTSLLADVIGMRTRYPEVLSTDALRNRDSNEMRYRVGVRWVATSKTTGDIRVGLVDHNALNPNFSDVSRVDWQAALAWTPRSYTQFEFQTGRHSQESYVSQVSFINNQFVNLAWSYDWTSLLNTRVSAGYIQAEFRDHPDNRQDDYLTAGVDLRYALTRDISLFGNASYNDRDSNVDDRDYSRFSAQAGVRFFR